MPGDCMNMQSLRLPPLLTYEQCQRIHFVLPEDVRRGIDTVFEKQCGKYGLKLANILPD